MCSEGPYQFKAMPFGLVNAPDTFKRLLERVLSGLQWQTYQMYLDDIIICSRGVAEHLRRLEDVLRRLEAAGLKLKPAKCKLMKILVTEQPEGTEVIPWPLFLLQKIYRKERKSILLKFLAFWDDCGTI